MAEATAKVATASTRCRIVRICQSTMPKNGRSATAYCGRTPMAAEQQMAVAAAAFELSASGT